MLKAVSLALLVLGVVACSRPEGPEAQVRRVIGAMQTAAQARDTNDLLAFVSDRYKDPYDRGREELSRLLRGYFLAYRSVHLLTRIDSLEFPFEDEARATILVGMAGAGSGPSSWDVAADLYEIRVTFALEGRDWKVTHAQWQRLAGVRP